MHVRRAATDNTLSRQREGFVVDSTTISALVIYASRLLLDPGVCRYTLCPGIRGYPGRPIGATASSSAGCGLCLR
jgi:hypothetical protein